MSMYNNIPIAVFYKDDSGKWQMRPPFWAFKWQAPNRRLLQ